MNTPACFVTLVFGCWLCFLSSLHFNLLQTHLTESSSLTPAQHVELQDRSTLKRLAIIRPFGKDQSKHLDEAFDDWGKHLPCHNDSSQRVLVDVFLSFSQAYETFQPAAEITNKIINTFLESKVSGGSQRWESCINNISRMEINIDPETDIYRSKESQTNRLWVHGPNEQFVKGLKTIINMGLYDVAFIMEGDVIPVRDYWLDALIAEAEAKEFAILGR